MRVLLQLDISGLSDDSVVDKVCTGQLVHVYPTMAVPRTGSIALVRTACPCPVVRR